LFRRSEVWKRAFPRAGDRPRLPLEALPGLGRRGHAGGQRLDRHRSLEPRVPRLVDLSHASDAERRQDLVGAEAVAGRERHYFFSPAVQFWTTVIALCSSGTIVLIRNLCPSAETSY
jgi:hypothetical protein